MKTKFTSIRNWELTRDVAAACAALTSVAVVWSIVYFNVLDVFGYRIIAALFALAAVVAVAFVVDWGLRVDLPYAFELLISGKAWGNPRITAFLVLLLGFNLVRSAATITLSWQGRKDMVEAVMEKPEVNDLAKTKSAIDASGAAKIDAARESITRLEKRIQEAESGARRENARLDSLARAGNAWASRKMSSAIKKATWNDRHALDEAQAALTLLLEQETRAGSVALQEIARADRERLVDHNATARRNMAYLGYFGAGCTGVVILVSLMLALINVVEQELPQYAKRYAVSTPPGDIVPVAAAHSDQLLATVADQSRVITEKEKEIDALRKRLKDAEKTTPAPVPPPPVADDSSRAHARTRARKAQAGAGADTHADAQAHTHTHTRERAGAQTGARTPARGGAGARELTCKQCGDKYNSEQEGASRKFCGAKCRDDYQASKGRK